MLKNLRFFLANLRYLRISSNLFGRKKCEEKNLSKSTVSSLFKVGMRFIYIYFFLNEPLVIFFFTYYTKAYFVDQHNIDKCIFGPSKQGGVLDWTRGSSLLRTLKIWRCSGLDWILWYCCYYPQRSGELVSPVCGIFFVEELNLSGALIFDKH